MSKPYPPKHDESKLSASAEGPKKYTLNVPPEQIDLPLHRANNEAAVDNELPGNQIDLVSEVDPTLANVSNTVSVDNVKRCGEKEDDGLNIEEDDSSTQETSYAKEINEVLRIKANKSQNIKNVTPC